ncbi:hypothetical protein P9112_006852 [Eukaryota sp. TZLM1-RC]
MDSFSRKRKLHRVVDSDEDEDISTTLPSAPTKRKRLEVLSDASDIGEEDELSSVPMEPSDTKPERQSFRLRLEDKERRKKERMEELLREQRELLDPASDEAEYYSEADDFVVGADGRPVAENEDEERISAAQSLFDYTKLGLPMPQKKGMVEVEEDEDEVVESRDHYVTGEDWPERLPRRKVDMSEVQKEGLWVSNHLMPSPTPSLITVVTYFLENILIKGIEPAALLVNHADKLEYFKNDGTSAELTELDVFKLMDLDQQWVRLAAGRKRLERLTNTLESTNQDIDTELLVKLSSADSIEAITDLSSYFELHYSHVLDSSGRKLGRSNPFERASKITLLGEDTSLLAWGHQWCLDGPKFLSNLTNQSTIFQPEDFNENPLDFAREFTCADCRTPEAVIKLVCSALSLEISKHPGIRTWFRGELAGLFTLSTRATAKGKDEIDGFHQYYKVKEIRYKPLSTISNDLFLLILKAQKDQLLKFSLDLPRPEEFERVHRHQMAKPSFVTPKFLYEYQSDRPIILESVKDFFKSSSYKENSQNWDELRESILSEMLFRHLIPLFKEEIKTKLTNEAKNYVFNSVIKDFSYSINAKPIVDYNPDPDPEDSVGVVGLYLGERDEPCVLTYLDFDGNMEEQLILANIHLRLGKGASVEVKERQREEWGQVFDLISRRNPSAIIIGAKGVETNSFVKKFDFGNENQIIQNLIDKVHIIPSYLSHIFASASIGSLLLPEASYPVRCSVSLARIALNPLNEYAVLAGSKADLLSHHHHVLQSELNQEFLYNSMLIGLSIAVAKQTVDINAALADSHYGCLFSLVPGFGPKKYDLLRDYALKHNFKVANRDDLLHPSINLCGSVTYQNCASFVIIPDSSDILAKTRIHPQDYGLAGSICAFLLEKEREYDPDNVDILILKNLVEDVRKRSELLGTINTSEIQSKFSPDVKITKLIKLIVNEIKNPLQDYRTTQLTLQADELFYTLTGTSRDDPLNDSIVSGTVIGYGPPVCPGDSCPYSQSEQHSCSMRFGQTDETRQKYRSFPGRESREFVTDVLPFVEPSSIHRQQSQFLGKIMFKYAMIKLDNNIIARVYQDRVENPPDSKEKDKLSHNEGTFESRKYFIQDILKVGSVVRGRVTEVYPDRFSAIVSLLSGDLVRDVDPAFRPRDEYCLPEVKEVVVKKEIQKTEYIMRPIQHHYFKNLTLTQAEQYLSDQDIGAFILRPARGDKLYELNLTIKFFHGIYFHLRVQNLHLKKHKSLLLGDKLKINPWFENALVTLSGFQVKLEFDDIDGIAVDFVEPFNRSVVETINYRKFNVNFDSWQSVVNILKANVADDPRSIHYYISFLFKEEGGGAVPGFFAIYYMVNGMTVPTKEVIVPTPKGFIFRNAMLSRISECVYRLKNDTKPQARTQFVPASVGWAHM